MTLSAPEPLTASHDVSAFDSGQPALDEWLRRHAWPNQQRRASRSFVVCEASQVVGYYALAAGSVSHTQSIDRLRRNMPDPVPMAMLGRLAVDRRLHGQGIGHAMLKDAMLRIIAAADQLAIRGILVDAIDDTARTFYERYGFRASPAVPLKLMVTLDEALRELQRAQSP